MLQRILAGLILGLVTVTANAALLGRLPATPGGSDYQAYYDDVLDITWLADANYAQTSGYDADGRMPWALAQVWVITLNHDHHLGVSDWRLPAVTDPGPFGGNCNFSYSGTNCGYNVDPASSEMAHLFDSLGNTSAYTTIGFPRRCGGTAPNYCLSNPGPFANLQPAEYWSGTAYQDPCAGCYAAWSFNFGSGGQQDDDRISAFYAWAVRDGDIDADEDGITEPQDNCTLVANPGQLDTDADDYGNLCDADLNNSGLTTSMDFNLLRSCINLPASTSATCAAADMNGSGLVTVSDFNLLRARINTAPGPSTVAECAPGSVGCAWEAGDMLTYYQGDWGDNPAAVLPAALLDQRWNQVFASTFGGLEVGIPGIGGYSLFIGDETSALNYLPATGANGPLTSDLLNPTSSSSGSFGGEVVTLALHINFSRAGYLGGVALIGDLNLCAVPGVPNMTVNEFLGVANNVLGGGSAFNLNIAVVTNAINGAFAGGIPTPFAHDHLFNGPCP